MIIWLILDIVQYSTLSEQYTARTRLKKMPNHDKKILLRGGNGLHGVISFIEPSMLNVTARSKPYSKLHTAYQLGGQL